MRRVAAIGWVFIFVLCLLPSEVPAQVIDRVSVDSAGIEGNDWSRHPGAKSVISADGRYVVFESEASNLVADDFNGWTDIFIRDRELNTTTRVSVSLAGGDANAPSLTPSISADGRYVAFHSAASNLVAGDTNWEWDIFRRDLQLGETVRVSVSVDGGDSNDDSQGASISADGRYVAFLSKAWNLVPGGSSRDANLFVRDMSLEETVLASVAWDGGAAETGCWGLTISGDGRHVAFVTTSDNIVNDDFNGILDVFVRDLDLGVTIRASVNRFGGDADQTSVRPSLNFDGSHVAFNSTATDLVEDDTNGVDDIFVRFLGDSPYTHRVNLSSQGDQTVDVASWGAHISPGARFVAFASDAENLVDADTNGVSDVFTHDRWTGTTRRVSVDQSGNQADDWSDSPSISSDGLLVVIRSFATNLVASDTNGVEDIFVCHGPATVFADGFETGDVTGWSSAVP